MTPSLPATGKVTELQKSLRLFNLKPSADFAEVKSSYRRLVKEWHPDRYPDDPGMRLIAEERIKEINIAYDFLARHFSQKRFTMRDKDGKESNIEQIVWQPMEKDLYWTSIVPDFMLPVLFNAFKDFGMKDLSWNTYIRKIRGTWDGMIKKTYHNLETEVEVCGAGNKTKVKFFFRYTHRADSIMLGLEEGPDIAGAVGKYLSDPRFGLGILPNLSKTYFQQFRLHEVTYNEIKSGQLTAEIRGNRLDIGGVTINQVLGLLYKSFTESGVEKVFWNTGEKLIFGTTGWSIRSAGQLIKAAIEGSGRQFGVILQSHPLAVGGIKESHLSDLGRGAEDEKRIRQHILDTLRGNR